MLHVKSGFQSRIFLEKMKSRHSLLFGPIKQVLICISKSGNGVRNAWFLWSRRCVKATQTTAWTRLYKIHPENEKSVLTPTASCTSQKFLPFRIPDKALPSTVAIFVGRRHFGCFLLKLPFLTIVDSVFGGLRYTAYTSVLRNFLKGQSRTRCVLLYPPNISNSVPDSACKLF